MKKWTPKKGDKCYYPIITTPEIMTDWFYWNNSVMNKTLQNRGLVCKTKTEAIKRGNLIVELLYVIKK